LRAVHGSKFVYFSAEVLGDCDPTLNKVNSFTMIKIKFIFATVFALSLSVQALAITTSDTEDCTDVDVRDQMEGDLRKHFYTAIHQGETGWCYAYAASDLVSQKLSVPVSAIYTGSYYQTQIGAVGHFARKVMNGKGEENQGGFIGEAIDVMKSLGQACTTRGVVTQGLFYYELVPQYEVFGDMDKFQVLLKDTKGKTCDEWCTKRIQHYVKYFVPNMTVSEVLQIVRRNSTKTMEQIMFSIVNANCGTNKVRLSPWMDYSVGFEESQLEVRGKEEFDNTKTLTYKLNRALDKGRVVGIEYNRSSINTDVGYWGGFHASTVIGRKTMNNRCYYQVRNSQGTKCDNYKPGVVCSPNDGSYWVDRETFKAMTIRITYFN